MSKEAPNFEKIAIEAGTFTSDAISTIWDILQDMRLAVRKGTRRATEVIEPRVLEVNAAASVDDLDLAGASVVNFTGSSAMNFTGMRAPDTGKTRTVFVSVTGTGTITAKHLVTSEAANQLSMTAGVDKTLATGAGMTFVYLNGKWREVS